MSILGVDIGVQGAVALLDDGGALIDVWPMPCLRDGAKNRRAINAPIFSALIKDALVKHGEIRTAFVERVGPRPGEGPVGAFAFGDCAGVVRGVLAAEGISIFLLTPPQWKRAVGLPSGKEGAKDRSRSEAARRWPKLASRFMLKGDDGRAEAALIGLAGLLNYDAQIFDHSEARLQAQPAQGAAQA
jgi:crossover junction endodeoxyribonuclease RuvC